MKKIFNKLFLLTMTCLVVAMLGLLPSANAQTFMGTGAGPIPATGTGGAASTPTVGTATVSGVSGTIVEVEVDITLTHTWASDLDITLMSPSGTTVELSTDNGGTTGLDATQTLVFNDNSSNLVTSWAAGIPAADYQPEVGSLVSAAGATPNGVWTLTIADDAGGDVGTLFSWNITLAANDCVLTCPSDVTVSNDPGVCEGTVAVANPTLDGMDCEILGIAADFTSIAGAVVDQIPDANGDLAATPFDITGVSPISAALTCVTEVCFTITAFGDHGAATEAGVILGENGVSIGSVGGAGGDCLAAGYTAELCVPLADYNAWAADGTISLTLDANTVIDPPFCATSTIQGSVNVPGDCVDFINSITGMANGPAVYPVGTTCITLTGTGSGSGMDFPIECTVKVTVEDTEAPTITCPGDFTFNLQGGECEQIYDYEVEVTDNCPTEGELNGSTFGSIGNCLGTGTTLGCPTFASHSIATIQEISLSALGNVRIDEGCFIYSAFSGVTNIVVNFYEAPAGIFAAQGTPPCYETATPVATSGVVDVTALGNDGDEVCVSVLDMNGEPYEVDDTTPGLYMEVLVPNALFNDNVVYLNNEDCNGVPADGSNTYICSSACTDGYLNSFGVLFDVFFSFTGQTIIDQPVSAGVNEFASGDALPIGVHCFEVNSSDLAGNEASCEWCVTVNEFPEDQIVTSLACNDLVNVSLNEDCEAFVSADQFLEGGPYGCYFNCYTVEIEGITGDVNGMTIGLDPGMYTVTVTDTCRQNSCWGEMFVEDKLAPEMPPIGDLTITCKDDVPTDVIDFFFDFNAVQGVDGIANELIGNEPTDQMLQFDVEASCDVTIEDLNVAVDITHVWMGDVDIYLMSPSGTQVALFEDQCTTADDMDVVFDDQGAAFDCALASPGTGLNIQPVNNDGTVLSDFNGESAAGTWTVIWRDDVPAVDDGFWNSMTLIFNEGVNACPIEITVDDYLSAVGSACQIVDLEVTEENTTGSDCEETTIVRTWVATDASGNSSTKVQTITQERIGVDALNDEWFWPEGIVELTCGADSSPEAIYNYFRDQWIAANPCPLPTCDETDGHNYDPDFVAIWECNANAAGVRWAYPLCFNEKGLQESFIDNACNIFFTYSDQVLPVCGPNCGGNSKIIRTWTALDWCTGDTEDGLQVIHAKDNEGPTASPLAPISVSANPWGCEASFQFPVPDHITDNCSQEVTYRIYGQPGTVTDILAGPRILLDSDDNIVYDANGYPVWVVDGLPKGGPYTYIYEFSDCCGNVSYLELVVSVYDGAAPVAIAKQNVVINLTSSPTDPNGGVAKLYVGSIDNGSHDGDCGPVRVAIRRTDAETDPEDNVGYCGNLGDDHNNNATFFNFNDLPNSQQPADHDRDDTDEGEFVKFCCQDLIDGEGEDLDGDGINDYVLIDVELGVWDDANMDGIPGTPGDLFGITWATVRVEAKLAPTLTCPPLAKITCEMDEKDLSVTGGSAYAASTCGALDVVYEDLCGLDINQDGVIEKFTVTNENGMLINEVAMCTDVNGDGQIANYVAPWWSEVEEDLFNKACHYGPITRWWSIAGTDVKCRQLIIVERPLDIQQFNGLTSIDWPYSEDEFIRLTDNDGDDCGLMEVSGSDIEQFDTNDDDIFDYAEVTLDCIDGLCDEPSWVEATCSLIGWSLDSDTFFFEGDACRKIINTYTVIDWCQYQPNDPFTGGIWTWTVIGKLVDPYAPYVEARDSMFAAVPGSGGSGTTIDERSCVGVGIQMPAVAFDTNIDEDGNVIENACPSEWLKWNVYLDINNDWVFDREWSSFVAEDRNTSTDPLWSEDNAADNMAVYGYTIPDVRVGNRGDVDNAEDFATEPGFEYIINIPDQIPADCGETQHRIEWKVYDGCGNVSSTTSYFTVQDKKAPTPYCINLSTALMEDPDGAGPEVSMVELWAIDFDYGSFDNCTAADHLRFTFSDVAPELDPLYDSSTRSSSRRFTCDDLQGSNGATITVPVYVWDICGNYDFCLANLRLIDNNPNGCVPDSTGSIAGRVYTEFGENIEEVMVSNENMMVADFIVNDMTEDDGEYAFYANTIADDYELTAEKDTDYLNGVSTLDLVLIQRHILGLENLDSPYKMIAADVNNDGAVTAIDLVELRKLILGIYEELPQNKSWRFVDADKALDINNPWNFEETISIYNLTTDMMSEDFIGVKIGDVDESVIANAASAGTVSRPTAGIQVEFEDKQVEVGQVVEVTVNANSFNEVYGYQFTMAANGLELVDVKSNAVSVSEENFGMIGNVITTSWNSDKPVTTNGALFTLTLKANTSGKLSEIIDINSEVTKAEAYVGAGLEIVNIDMNNTTESAADFALYQNEPNPFTSKTTVGFVMPEAADATMTILDVTGKVVKSINGNYAKGYNEIELSKSDLGAGGVYYYQLDSGDFTATKKMIIIE